MHCKSHKWLPKRAGWGKKGRLETNVHIGEYVPQRPKR